ncbi:hypothetical protein ACFX2J_025290 [Malus domestica]
MRSKQKGHIKLTRKHIKITRDTLQEYIGGKHDLSELMIYDFDSILVAIRREMEQWKLDGRVCEENQIVL